jgi:hypothetical protein
MDEQRKGMRRVEDERCGDCRAIRERTDECLQLIKKNLDLQRVKFDEFSEFVNLRHDTARRDIDVKIGSKVSHFTLKVAVGLLGFVFAAFTWQVSELRLDLKNMPAIAAIQHHVVETQAHVVSIQQDLVMSLSEMEPVIKGINKKIDNLERMEIEQIEKIEKMNNEPK